MAAPAGLSNLLRGHIQSFKSSEPSPKDCVSRTIQQYWDRNSWYNYPYGTAVVIYRWPQQRKTEKEEYDNWYSSSDNQSENKENDNMKESKDNTEEKEKKESNSTNETNETNETKPGKEEKQTEFDNIIDVIDYHGSCGNLNANELHIYHSEAREIELSLNDAQYGSANGIHYSGMFRTKFHYLEHYGQNPKRITTKPKKKKKKKGSNNNNSNNNVARPVAPLPNAVPPFDPNNVASVVPLPPPLPLPGANDNGAAAAPMAPPAPARLNNNRANGAVAAPSPAPVPPPPPFLSAVKFNNASKDNDKSDKNDKKNENNNNNGNNDGYKPYEEMKMFELKEKNKNYRPAKMAKGKMYKKPNNGEYDRCVTVQNNEEFGIFHSYVASLDYIIILKKDDWRMCLFLSKKARWDARWLNKHNVWFIFELLIERYKEIYNYSINKSILDSFGGGIELTNKFNQIVIRQQRMLQWGHGSMSETITKPTEVIFGNKTNQNNDSTDNNNSNNDKNDSRFDQLLGISASNAHTLFRTSFGSIYAYGSNSYGQLGVGDRKSRSQTSVVTGLQGKTIVELACGSDYSMALTNDGNVYIWGSIENGQIGIDPLSANALYERLIFERNDERRRLMNANNNNENESGASHLSPHLREQIEATQAQIRGNTSEESGGNNGKDKKKDEKNESKNEESAGLDEDDSTQNDDSKNDENESNKNEKDAELTGDALLKDILNKFSFDGGAVCVTSPIKLQSLERLKIVKIAAGNCHSMCVDNQGNVWAFGSNEMGQLGLGKYENVKNDQLMRDLPENKNDETTESKVTENENNGTDDNNNNNNESDDNVVKRLLKLSPYPTKIENIPKIQDVCCGANHTLLLTVDGQVYGFGSNYDGYLGFGDTRKGYNLGSIIYKPQKIEFAKKAKIVQIASGATHHAALSNDGKVFLWGLNTFGQCNHCNDENDERPCLKKICIDSENFSKIVPITNQVSLKHMQLVQEKINNEILRLKMQQEKKKTEEKNNNENKSENDNNKNDEDSMIAALMEVQKTFDVKENDSLKDISWSKVVCGKNHTLLLSTDGKVYSCGQDVYGQLGHEGERTGSQWELVPVYIEKRIYDIATCGNQSFAIEGLSSTRLGQLLWRTYQQSVKNESKKKLFDIEMKLTDGSKCYLNKSILYKRCNVFYNFIIEYLKFYTKTNNSDATTEMKNDDLGGLDDDDTGLGGLDDDDDDAGIGGIGTGSNSNNNDGNKNDNKVFIDLSDKVWFDKQENSSKLAHWEIIKEIDEATMLRLLEYIYSGAIQEFTFWDKQNGQKMMDLASKLSLSRLCQIYGGTVDDKDAIDRLSDDMADIIIAANDKTNKDFEFIEPTCDITFVLENGSKKYKGHKYLIVNRSNYFNAMLMGSMHESRSNEIHMPNEMSYDVFNAFIYFLYCDKLIDGLDINQLVMLWGVCHQFLEAYLFEIVESTIIKKIDESSVFGCLQAATLYNAKKLKQFCIETIVSDLWQDNWDFESENNPIYKLNESLQQDIKKARAMQRLGRSKKLEQIVTTNKKRAVGNLKNFFAGKT